MFKIILTYAVRNIFRTRLRSFFALFSVTLIILLYSILTGISHSFTKQISTLIKDQNIDIAIQAKYASSPVTSIIDKNTTDKIVNMNTVQRYDSLLINRTRIRGKSAAFLLGVSDFNTFSIRLGFNITQGRSIKDADNEVVIGEKMSKVFNLHVNDTLKLSKGKTYKIVGLFSSWLNFLNMGVITDLSSAQYLMDKKDKISLLLLKLKDTTKIQQTLRYIEKNFPDMRAVESMQLPNHLGPIKSIFYFSKIISVLTLMIAVAVLLNIFIMALSERTKEIGILSAIGWSKMMIIEVFLLEALLLSYFGSILGYTLSYPVMQLLQNSFPEMSMYFPSSPDITVFANVMLISLITAVFSIIFPILYITKIQIAKAIRHE